MLQEEEEVESDLLSRQKDAEIVGTYENDAFVLSLRRPGEFTTTHSFGYHRIPHIGVYGTDYSLALPMVLLSLPNTPKYLAKLPSDVLGALDLGHLAAPLTPTSTPPSTPQHLLSQRVISTLHTHHCLPSQLQLREIARELVQYVISSALRRLSTVAAIGHSFSQTNSFTVSGADKRRSVTSIMSDGEEATLRHQRGVSIQIDGTIMEFDHWTEEEEEEEEEGEGEEEEDDVLRIIAKKVVKKALHLACKRWESMNRRCSIDYLVASAKRLKISSPSPPPTLPEIYEEGVSADLPTSGAGWSSPSPTHDRGLGLSRKKRNRSESHDVMMMKELERFRRGQMGTEKVEEEERVIAKPRRTGGSRTTATKRGDTALLKPQESLGDLVSNIRKLSIQRTGSESDDNVCSSEEDYTILSGVTKPDPSGSNSECSASTSPMPPPNSPTVLQVMKLGPHHHYRSPSPLLHIVLPSALADIPEYSTSSEEENTTCTSPEFRQRLSSVEQQSHSLPSTVDPILLMSKDSLAPDIDYFIVLHTHPPPGLCQKFLCNNTDEVNLIYHCWLFPNVPFEPDIMCSEQLEMGVFRPQGVAPVHQDLQDAGVSFHYLEPRTVCIHSCHFSPENAQLQLLPHQQMHSFFSAARHGTHRVVALHLIPGLGELEETLRERLRDCFTLGDLLIQLATVVPSSSDLIKQLILT